MKRIVIVLLAALTLAACTEYEPRPNIDNTSWRYQYINGNRQTTYTLSIFKGKGELIIREYYNEDYKERYEYTVQSYTMEDDDSGELKISGVTLEDLFEYIPFELSVNNTKLTATFPNRRRATLDRYK